MDKALLSRKIKEKATELGFLSCGIAKADEFDAILKNSGFLTRDSRVVEHKKYGKRTARKSAQFSKR